MDEQTRSVMFSSNETSVITPFCILHAIRAVTRRRITLDPCSFKEANHFVRAKHYWTEGALSKDWNAVLRKIPGIPSIYMNPPYGRGIDSWIKKFDEVGSFFHKFALLPARTETKWFQPLWKYDLCSITGRLKFMGATNCAPFPSVVVYWGRNRLGFELIFGELGKIVRANRDHDVSSES